MAAQVISRVRKVFGVEIPLRGLFEEPTIAGLAALIEKASESGNFELQASSIPPVARGDFRMKRTPQGELVAHNGSHAIGDEDHIQPPAEDVYVFPTSYAQERLWFLDQFEPNSPFYNVPAAVRLTGSLDARALERGLNEIVRRHEALRTTFSTLGVSPIQIIAPTFTLSVPIIDLSEMLELEREGQAMRMASEQAQRPFDLTQLPLVRASLLRLKADDHVLILVVHHIVFDGWSLGVFMREIASLYGAFSVGEPSPLPELSIQYADFSMWQRDRLRGETLESHISYWKDQLADAPTLLELPADRMRPRVQSYRGALQSFRISKELSRELKDLSQREGVTLFMTLLSAFYVLLYRCTGQRDIVVGTPVANRNHLDTEKLIGVFINALALRVRLEGSLSFLELLYRVQQATMGAYAHQDLPFERLVQRVIAGAQH